MTDITAILTCYRRPFALQEQVQALLAQSVPPTQIWVWKNAHPDNEGLDASKIKGITACIDASHNFRYHGRFALGLLTDAKYVAFFDDDTLPGENWFKNCLDTMETHEGILGGAGVLMQSRIYDNPGFICPHLRVGWPSENTQVEEADLVGHAWFLKREHLNYLWREVPYTLENCEDMQLSYMAQKYGNVKTYCPPHPSWDKSLWSSLRAVELGDDAVASSNSEGSDYAYFCSLRNKFVSYAIDNGWKTVKGIL
jgi:hypothetical protein